MPPVVADLILVTAKGAGSTVTEVENTWALEVLDPGFVFNEASASDISDAFVDFYELLAPQMPTNFAWSTLRVQDRRTIAGIFYEFTMNVGGSSVAVALPGEVAICLSRRSNEGGGGRFRGRNFLGPWTIDVLDANDGTVDETTRTLIFDSYVALQAALVALDVKAVIWSRMDNNLKSGEVTASVDRYFDTVRRRGLPQ